VTRALQLVGGARSCFVELAKRSAQEQQARGVAAERVVCIRMPYRAASLTFAQLRKVCSVNLINVVLVP
jgi:hypothetical protein